MKDFLKKRISVLILACTAAVLLALSGCSMQSECASGEFTDSPYPCTWAEQENGSIVISFTGELPEDSTFTVLTSSDAIKAEQQADAAVFTVMPSAEGSGTLMLCLRESEAPVARGENYEFTFSVEKQKLKLKMTYCGAAAVSVVPESFETDSGSIYWSESSVGSIFIKSDDANWYEESCEGVVTVGHLINGTGSGIEVIAVEDAEQWSMILRNAETGERCRITFSYTDGVLSVTEYGAAPEEEETLSEEDVYFAAIEAAETEEEKETLRAEYEELMQEKQFLRSVDRWTENHGREPDENELEELRSKYFRR